MAGLWKNVFLAALSLMCLTSQWVIFVQAEDPSTSEDLVNNEAETRSDTRTIENLKRANAFLRIGKTKELLRLTRNPNSFFRIERAPMNHFVRIGKRSSRAPVFLRIGKKFDESESENLNDYAVGTEEADRETRASPSSFLRIGKAAAENRGFLNIDSDEASMLENSLPMLRMSRSLANDAKDLPILRLSRSLTNDAINKNKRTNTFLRIGRVPTSAFNQIYKLPSTIDSDAIVRRRSGRPIDTFMKLGKRAAKPEGNHDNFFSDLNAKSQ
ncbi:FMRFamide neuropeptides-like [Argonauta hians]